MKKRMNNITATTLIMVMSIGLFSIINAINFAYFDWRVSGVSFLLFFLLIILAKYFFKKYDVKEYFEINSKDVV